MDKLRAERAVRELLISLDQDVSSEGLLGTPARVADMLVEQCTAQDAEIEVTFHEDHFGGMVIVRDIPFKSMCQHHMVFYVGHAHVGYIPRRRILGLSKLARLVYSKCVGLTTQESVTAQIADELWGSDEVACQGCMVVLEAEHGCISLRGARAIGSSTVTSEVRGVFLTNQAAREEFLALVGRLR